MEAVCRGSEAREMKSEDENCAGGADPAVFAPAEGGRASHEFRRAGAGGECLHDSEGDQSDYIYRSGDIHEQGVHLRYLDRQCCGAERVAGTGDWHNVRYEHGGVDLIDYCR